MKFYTNGCGVVGLSSYWHEVLYYGVLCCRSGVGAPVVGDCDGEYNFDSRKSVLQWNLAVIDANNESGSMEFSIAGHPDDFFPVNVNFISKNSYCDLQVIYRSDYFCYVFSLSVFKQIWIICSDCRVYLICLTDFFIVGRICCLHLNMRCIYSNLCNLILFLRTCCPIFIYVV